MYLGDIITQPITEITGLGILVIVLRWLGKVIDRFVDQWIATEKARTARIEAGTKAMQQDLPRLETKLNTALELLNKLINHD